MKRLLPAIAVALLLGGCMGPEEPAPLATTITTTTTMTTSPTSSTAAPRTPAARATTTSVVPSAKATSRTTTTLASPPSPRDCTGTDPKNGRPIRYALEGYVCDQAKADWRTYLTWPGPFEGSGGFATIRPDTQCWSDSLEPWGGCEISDGGRFEVFSR